MFGSAASSVSSNLPVPGKTGFSEAEALKHVKALTQMASHPLDSHPDLNPPLQYVFKECQNIKEKTDGDVDVELDLVPAKSGNSGPKNVVLRILPKSVSEAKEKSVLVSAHIDTVFSKEAADDDVSTVAVMLELARGISQSGQGLKNSVIFFFNSGEEEGLDGAHSFITQHPWSQTIRVAIDLDSLGLGPEARKPSVLLDLLPEASKPITNIQDVFKDASSIPGLDFAFTDEGNVYHTKNDKINLLKRGAFQHLGENMLPFLLHVAASTQHS